MSERERKRERRKKERKKWKKMGKKLLLTDALDGALRVDALDVPGGVVPDEDAVDAVLAALAAALEKLYLYIRERHKKKT